MTTHEKHWIGTGRQQPGSAYITIRLCLEDLLTAEMTEQDGKHYLKAVVARKRYTTGGGTTHSVYVPVLPDPKELEYGMVADQQEIESLNCEG